jgi:ABC-type transport system involved in multi-copper enzyme maturation permease subunit
MPPGFFNHLLLISLFELKRAFATRKGLLSLITFAVVWYFILLYPLRFAAELLAQEKGLKQHFGFLDFIGWGSIHNWPIPEFGVFWQVALIIFPILSITLAADQTCSDRERGTLRFIVLRSSRDRVFFGRFAGVMMIQASLISAAALSTFALALYRDATLFASSACPNLLALIVNLILVVLPFTALMATLSAQVKSPRQATLWAILIWTFLAGLINGFAGYLPALAFLKLLIPGYQLAELTQLSGWQPLQLAYIPVLQSVILLAFGRWIMARKAL